MLPEDIVGCSLEQVEWEADYYGLKELLKIIGERKTAKGKKKEEERPKMSSSDKVREEEPKTSSLEFAQKALEMRKKAADLVAGFSSEYALIEEYYTKASEYEEEAADLRRRGY